MKIQIQVVIFTFLFASLSIVSYASAQHLHAVVVVDSHDGKIGKSVLVDGQNVVNWIQESLPAHRYTLHIIEGKDATPDNVISDIRNLRVGSNDAVLFYYSGHGAFDDRFGSHYFQFSTTPKVLQRTSVKNAIQSLAPRLSVMISDCCATILPLRRDERDSGLANAVGRDGTTPIVEELFFDSCGVVDITSSRPGQFSVGYDNGGVFTNAFLSVVRDYDNERPIWDEVFSRTRKRASTYFENKNAQKGLRLKGVSNQQFTQTAWSFEPMYNGNPNVGRLGVFIEESSAGLITSVEPGSAARLIGLEPGDRILSVNGINNLTTSQIVHRVNNSAQNLHLAVVCFRTGNRYLMSVKLPF